MKFESNYTIGEVVEYVSLQKTLYGAITGVLFNGTDSPLYEINKEDFLEERAGKFHPLLQKGVRRS